MMKSVVFSVLALCLVTFVICQEEDDKMCELMKKWVREEICERGNSNAKSCLETNIPKLLADAMAEVSGNQDFSTNVDSFCAGTLKMEDVRQKVKDSGEKISDEEKEKLKECLTAE